MYNFAATIVLLHVRIQKIRLEFMLTSLAYNKLSLAQFNRDIRGDTSSSQSEADTVTPKLRFDILKGGHRPLVQQPQVQVCQVC